MKTCYNCFHELGDTVRICPSCGMGADISNAAQYPHALPCGSVLAGKYVTGRVLGQGGFGITYVAQNYQTKELAAIKEYYPDSMAIREGSHSVTPYNMDRSSNYEYGKERFLEEAKTLSEFIGNPYIVRVISYFEENGTAYFVMEYVKGISLKKYLQGKGGKISWQEAMQLLKPVMDALSAVHDKGIIHRDVTPDNIVITDDGNVKLLDFGSARYSIGERSQSLDVILKHGFAPYEQYIRRSRQGSFTDVYSLAATFYFAITGTTPPEAVERIDNDTLQLPSALGIDIPAGVEAALVKALAVRVGDRIRTMDEFKKALGEGAEPGRPGLIPTEDKEKTGQEDWEISSETAAGSPGTVAAGSSGIETASDETPPAAGQDTSSTQNKEIDLTQYTQNKSTQQGADGQNQEKKIPKWLIPAAAAAAIALIVLFLWGRSGGAGTESGNSGQAAAGATGAQASNAEAGDADELSPEIRELLSKAEAGDAAAQYELGKSYFDGSGVEQNYEEALAWYTKAAEQGNTDAQYGLGEIYHKGDGTDKDDTQALKYYRLAAEQGYAPAQTKTGVMLQTGEGADKNEEEAVKWFQKAADQEDAQGQYCLGMIYLNGIDVQPSKNEDTEDVTVTDTDAETDLSSASDAFADADQLQDGELTRLPLNGIDYAKAIDLFTKAAAQGLPEAQNALGDCCKTGIGTVQNFEDALTWYTKAAEKGLPEAQFNLAETYAEGRGVEQSDEQAAAWYTCAADLGLARAQTNLGVLYAQGKGVAQSEEEAFKWFEKAAEQEDPAGQLDLAYMFLTGTGTKQDYDAALTWLKKTAENEDEETASVAIFTLAEMYAEGIGVEKNEEEAAAWRERDGYDESKQSLPGNYETKILRSVNPKYSDNPYFCLFCGTYLGSKAELQSETSEVQEYLSDGWEFADAPVTTCCGKHFDCDGKEYLEYLNSMLNGEVWEPAPEYDTDWM